MVFVEDVYFIARRGTVAVVRCAGEDCPKIGVGDTVGIGNRRARVSGIEKANYPKDKFGLCVGSSLGADKIIKGDVVTLVERAEEREYAALTEKDLPAILGALNDGYEIRMWMTAENGVKIVAEKRKAKVLKSGKKTPLEA